MTTVDRIQAKDTDFKPIEYADYELGITVKELEGGVRLFEMGMGKLGRVHVLDIPGSVISDGQWQMIERNRESYAHVWGGIKAIKKIIEDPFEGKPPYDQKYITHHQFATFTSPDGIEKELTNRKVSLNPNAQATPALYDDIVFWEAINSQTGERAKLEDLLKTYVIAHGADPLHPEQSLSAISRTGTYPYQIREKDEEDHDKTAIAWAMMQIAVTYKDSSKLYSCMLCPEFQDKILTIRTADGTVTKLDFAKTVNVLQLGSEWNLQVDRSNRYVQDTMLEFPGYWLDGNLRVIFKRYVSEGILDVTDFLEAGITLLQSDEKVLLKEQSIDLLNKLQQGKIENFSDIADLIDLLTIPRYCKYLIPLINTKGDINEKLTGQKLREDIIQEVQERAFSSTLDRSQWLESVKRLLRAAKSKYNE